MQQPETLQSNERLSAGRQLEQQPAGSPLTAETADELQRRRLKLLEEIRPLMSLKLYHKISDKLEKEHASLAKFLNWEEAKQDALSHYSFILDTQYFEQKFLS